MQTKIKICGLTRIQEVEAVNAAHADYAGFVFYKKSRRNLAFAKARELLAHLDKQIRSVAVCVSPTAEEIEKLQALGMDIIQIHGTIPREGLDAGGSLFWQAVNLKDGPTEDCFCRHPQIAGYVVDGADYGGGRTFGWEHDPACAAEIREILKPVLKRRNLILAGGLNAENVAQGIALFQPDAVDVSSGVETAGKKDREKIDRFIRKVREQ